MEVISLIFVFTIVAIGIYTDLRFRKVPNKLSIALFIAAVLFKGLLYGKAGLVEGFIGVGAVIGLMLPLVLARALGAGDMKLMLSFGMATNWSIVFWTLIYSIIWGAIVGVIVVLLNKQGAALLSGMKNIVMSKGKTEPSEMHKIPYTVALFLGLATYVVLKGPEFSLGFGL